MFPVSGLPRCVALRSKHDNRFLRCVHDESQGGSVVELCSGGDGDGDGGVMNPRCRFYLEASKEHDGQLHVRCCYNNKYWVPQQTSTVLGGGSSWIIGTAHEPEEDLSKPSCTLFELGSIPAVDVGDDDDGFTASCRFLCSHLGRYAGVVSSYSTSSDMVAEAKQQQRSYLHVAANEEETTTDQDNDQDYLIDGFTVRDLSGQLQLPTYLAFKGDNGDFLGATSSGGHNYLQFSAKDIGASSVTNTIYTNTVNGVVRIKSNYFGMYWRRSPNWIWADSSDTTYNNRDTLFTVTTGADFIALRNLGNDNFCKRLSADSKDSCLNAAVTTITKEARLECYEPVISRDIYDVDFRLDEAKISTKGVDGLTSQTVNNATTSAHKTTLYFTYTKTVQSTWSSTVSMKIGVKANLKAGIPFILGGEIEVSAEFNGSYTWGKTETEEKQTTEGVDVEVPPMKKLMVKAIASNGVCDIPFSYTQRDVLTNGQQVTKKYNDGMYVGVKTSDITFNITEQDL